jgi:RimJ/RimL family protein N-acetyltransferase
VVAETQSANKRSVRLLKSLGFVAARQLERFDAQQTLFELRCPGGNAA